MYAVDDKFEDLEPGMVIRWNGKEETIAEVRERHVVFENIEAPFHRRLVDMWLASEDTPFEVVR